MSAQQNNPVAIKIKSIKSEKKFSKKRSLNELRALIRLDNSSISPKVLTWGFDEETNKMALVEEFISGSSPSKMSFEDAISFIFNLTLLVSKIYSLGILHLDLKPQNILISESGSLKLVDFGLAHFVSNTSDFSAIGTPGYSAPEQILTGTVSVKSDLFSIGAILYEYLFESRLDRSIYFSDYSVPHFSKSDVLSTILLRTISKNPTDRYDSSTELLSDLEKF